MPLDKVVEFLMRTNRSVAKGSAAELFRRDADSVGLEKGRDGK